jgi:glycosyltransferase involved in cell wall biosynthesis
MNRPRLTVATSYTIHPPRGGGQQRVFELYRALGALGWEVDVIALADRGAYAGARELAPGLREIRVPRTREHEYREYALGQRAGIPAGDIALALYHDLTPAYADAIAASAAGAAAVVASHPFALPAIRAATTACLIYEAHNVEADLKAATLAAGAGDLAAVVEDVERDCCTEAALVIACSESDAQRLGERYGVDDARLLVVPNGVDVRGRSFTSIPERRAAKERLGLGDVTHALFLGSWHEPNVVAVRTILAAAHLARHIRFIVVGSVGLALGRIDPPPNVDLCGVVDAGFVTAVLSLADVALNPMHGGSGTNLKMLDYAASGVPLLSSPVGARGLGFEPAVHYAATEPEPEALTTALDALQAEPEPAIEQRARAARTRVEDVFDWSVIAQHWVEDDRMRELMVEVPA